MSDSHTKKSNSWCIVVADDHGPEYVPSTRGAASKWPVQYCGFGERTTSLQRALHRAKKIAPTAHIVVTVREENREHWEPALWFIRPEQRFVSDTRIASSLTTAAALLSIAADSISHEVTILPARHYVADEWILSAALHRLQALLPRIPEGVGTLGMIDIDSGIDEDYLVPFTANRGVGVGVQGMARQPDEWVASHLRQQGAMVSSGILIGYAGRFAAHIWRHRPSLTKALASVVCAATDGENRLSQDRCRDVSRSELRPLRWWPPTFAQRVFPVYRCGWRGLHTVRAVAKISASNPLTIDSVPQPHVGRELKPVRSSRIMESADSEWERVEYDCV